MTEIHEEWDKQAEFIKKIILAKILTKEEAKELAGMFINHIFSCMSGDMEYGDKLYLDIIKIIKEEYKWGVPVYDNEMFYIGVVRYGVNLGFKIKHLNKDELDLFDGTGKTMRHKKYLKTVSMCQPVNRILLK